MKIFGWPADSAACGLYRIGQPLEQLAQRGHLVHFAQIMPAEWMEADIVIAQRTCGKQASNVLKRIREIGKAKIVMELDDDLLNTDPTIGPPHQFFKLRDVQVRLIRNISEADMVTVSTEPLAEMAARHNGNVVMLPNCIDDRIFSLPAIPRQDDDKLIIGWEGSATHRVDWTIAQNGVARFLRATPHGWMWFLGHSHPEGLPDAQVLHTPWTTDFVRHYQRVAQFDIGLAPLWRSPFNRSKSHLRALTYCALGVPGIYSAEPAYTGFIEHGRTGFLAKAEHDWFKYLRELAGDPLLRETMASQGRQWAAQWTIQAKASLWEDAYANLLGLAHPLDPTPGQPGWPGGSSTGSGPKISSTTTGA
jgi:hypothetical protein